MTDQVHEDDRHSERSDVDDDTRTPLAVFVDDQLIPYMSTRQPPFPGNWQEVVRETLRLCTGPARAQFLSAIARSVAAVNAAEAAAEAEGGDST